MNDVQIAQMLTQHMAGLRVVGVDVHGGAVNSFVFRLEGPNETVASLTIMPMLKSEMGPEGLHVHPGVHFNVDAPKA